MTQGSKAPKGKLYLNKMGVPIATRGITHTEGQLIVVN